jgi:OPA family glycerol-3-phosphate transporter-like MFS transporter 3
VACASFHASREAYVAVKGDFQRHLHFPTQLLGLLDTTFLVCYGVGLLFSGSIGARFGNKTVASVGLAGTAAVLATHGFLSKGWLTAAPRDADDAWAQGLSLYVPLVALNGLVQSLGFPNLVAVTSGWVDPTQRGLVLGLWSTTGAAGDIIGLNVATAVLDGGVFSWQTVFFAVAGYLGLMTVVLFFFVEDRSGKQLERSFGEETDETKKADELNSETTKLLGSTQTKKSSSYGNALSGLAEAWLVPGVLDWSMSYFFIKTVTYTILFWMPYYLTLTLDSQATADNLTVLFDVSMILGTTALGLVTDRANGARSPLFVCSFVFGAAPLLFLPALRQSAFHYAAAFIIVGVFSGGPAHMYGTAVSVDLGEAAAAAGKPNLVSSLSGLIDGIGTLGAAVGQSIVARVASEGERSAAQAAVEAIRTSGGVSPDVSDAVLRGTYTSSGDVEQDEAAGFTDATFEMPSGMAVDENGLPLYVETPEHHAGGEKKGIARIVSDMLAGDAEMQKNLPGHVMDVDAATSQASTSASGSASGSASSLGSNLGVERFVSGVARLGGAVSSVSSAGVSAGSASASVGPASAHLSDTVDDGFQQRWSRVFFMLFAFNLLAAGTLLRVAAWEMRRLGWLGGAERAKATGTSARRP